MESYSLNDHPAYGFCDLNGLKDFVSMVISCAPDLFIPYDWLPPEQQLTLERAFAGIRFGLDLMKRDGRDPAIVLLCHELVEEACALYQAGQDHAGQKKLEEMEKLLQTLAS
jgi:hypothetical protein